MFRRIILRLAVFVVSLAAASLAVFLACQALPGDVAQVILGQGADPADVARLRTELGLERPLAVRYGEWVWGALQGDLGRSWMNRAAVSGLVAPKLVVTLWLVIPAMLLATVIAIPVGMFAAAHRRTIPGVAVAAGAQLGMAVPAFLAGIVLVVVFAVELRWLPAGGWVDPARNLAGAIRHMALPVISLALVQGAILSRYVRSATVEVLSEDWFRTARSIGSSRVRALATHGLRNIATALVTVLALQLATLLVGAIVVEQVFQLPGLGQLLLRAVSQRDLVMVQGIVMVLVACVLVINFLVDLAYLWIDPRLRRGASL